MTGTVCRGMVSSWWPMSSKTRQVSPTRGGWLCMHNAQCERWGAERRGVSSRCAGCSLWRFTDWTLNIRIIRWFRVFVEEILHAFTNLQRRSIRKKKESIFCSYRRDLYNPRYCNIINIIVVVVDKNSLKLLQRCACHPTSHKILKT